MLFDSIQLQPRRKRLMSFVASMVLHASAIAALIILPLIFFNKLPDLELVTFLYQPPEPPPPPPPPVPPAFRPQTIVAKYSVPTAIPKSIPPPDTDTPPVVDKSLVSSINVGVPGGVLGGSALGLAGGVLGKQLPLPPPPKPVEEAAPVKPPVKPIFVGGDVQEAKLIYKQPAIYPSLALKARISGTVLLRITVNEEGTVSDVKVINGHPLLVPAAVDAVSHWKYKPTILNGQPYPVIATVAVNFMLQ